MLLRTQKTQNKYEKLIAQGFLASGCNLCDKNKIETVKDFKYWKIVKAKFPWDRIARKQDLIIPKRHITYDKLNNKEKKEFDSVKINYIEKNYDLMAEATNKRKSIPEHFHIHLIVLKK